MTHQSFVYYQRSSSLIYYQSLLIWLFLRNKTFLPVFTFKQSDLYSQIKNHKLYKYVYTQTQNIPSLDKIVSKIFHFLLILSHLQISQVDLIANLGDQIAKKSITEINII